ncbi:hypothetical protein KKQ10_24565 [Pseudomonas sp. MG-9]|uniref:hypothetical protein n=1 Tax=Pseudomonas sp. MG-9 TaxID=2839032 RepID=UPI001BFFFCB1|nr:hypothetical protein [Pseudomonas sp. MG-9]MBT9268053.1 hypothetical protein [Pseudomonas sp. MG-9]
MSELKVIYLGPACQEQGQSSGREWCQDDVWDACECGHESVRYVLASEFDRVTAERDALQQRLNAADQRIDEQAGLLRRSVMAVREQQCEPGEADFDLPTELMADIDAQLSTSTEPEQDDDWHMNPCKQGHRDVGAAGGVAACNQCDEKIEAATTQEAFERWNAEHPAPQSIPDQLRDATKMIGIERMPPMEYDEP